MNELMNLFLKNGLLRKGLVLDKVSRTSLVTYQKPRVKLSIRVKFSSKTPSLDAICDQSKLDEVFEAIDGISDERRVVNEFKKILKSKIGPMLPSAYVLDLPNRNKVKVDVTKTRLLGEAATMIQIRGRPIEETKLAGKRMAAAICCLDEILKGGDRSEKFEKRGATAGEMGYRFVKKIRNQVLGEFTAVVTLVEYFGKNTNTHAVNAEGGFDFENVVASLDKLKMHSASEFEFYGEQK